MKIERISMMVKCPHCGFVNTTHNYIDNYNESKIVLCGGHETGRGCGKDFLVIFPNVIYVKPFKVFKLVEGGSE